MFSANSRRATSTLRGLFVIAPSSRNSRSAVVYEPRLVMPIGMSALMLPIRSRIESGIG